ncbi:MAG: Imm27 family immunity protein [Rhodospirillaceae bacterium]
MKANSLKGKTELVGQWLRLNDGRVEGDETCGLIRELVLSVFKKVANSEDGWDVLYLDPRDGRYWEMVFPQGEGHGGGPPSLMNLSKDEAIKKYNI